MTIQAVNVKNDTGLHARPASDFCKLATSMPCDVFIEKDGKRVTAKSILGVLSLAITKGSVIDIITDGENEEAALVKLVDFVDSLSN